MNYGISMTWTNADSVSFNFGDEDKKLFKENQQVHWENISDRYSKLKKLVLEEVKIPIVTSRKKWISSRVNLHASTSLIRLLYLTESFRDSALQFNAVASAIHVKAMIEIPLHLGYLVWILDNHNSFEDIRKELGKISFGNRSKEIGLTTSSKISQKVFYTKADEMFNKFFKDDPKKINILEMVYKEANSTGHHNYEARNALTGLQTDDVWEIKDRKEWFVFYINNIFQFFLHASTILWISWVFMDAIERYLKQLPDKAQEELT